MDTMDTDHGESGRKEAEFDLLRAAMGRKDKAGGKSGLPNPKAVPNRCVDASEPADPRRELLQRLNFLYQASASLSASSSSSRGAANGARDDERVDEGVVEQPVASTSSSRSEGKKNRRAGATGDALDTISRNMTSEIRGIAQKAVLRIDPSVKRALCKICGSHLLPGVTSSVRIKSSGPHGHVVRSTCLQCGETTRLPAPPRPEPPDATDAPAPPIFTGRRAKKRRRQARPAPFFEHAQHTVFRGEETVQRDA